MEASAMAFHGLYTKRLLGSEKLGFLMVSILSSQ